VISRTACGEQTVATGQEYWQALQVYVDVRLVNAYFVKPQPWETAVDHLELVAPATQSLPLDGTAVMPGM
jgi:hypothetical protein